MRNDHCALFSEVLTLIKEIETRDSDSPMKKLISHEIRERLLANEAFREYFKRQTGPEGDKPRGFAASAAQFNSPIMSSPHLGKARGNARDVRDDDLSAGDNREAHAFSNNG